MAVCGDAGCGKKGGSSPKVACPTCQTETAVPTSVAAVRLAVAVETTKTTAMQAREASEKQYNHWVAVPEQFNCQKCNAKLMVPPPQVWMCQTAGCGTNNTPDVVECSVCKQKLKPKVMCGVCMTVTDIPSNNFLNSVRSTRNNTVKAVDDVKKTASFVSENRESVRAAGAFVQENPEIGKAVAKSAK
jgi:transcription elongation factor Elf1